MAIYNNRMENLKSVFLIDNILGRIEESVNEVQDGKLTLYLHTRNDDNQRHWNHNEKQVH